MHFFSPKIHSLRATDGRAVSEFPILNYTVAFLWKIFGEHEFIYRLLEYIIYITSIFILFNTLLKYFKFYFNTFFAVSLLLTSPLLVYYSFNFLSDVPALSFCIMAFCFLFSFYKTRSLKYFYLSLLLGTLAVLLKASALIALACLVFFSLVDLFSLNRFFKTGRLFKQKLVPALLILISLVIVGSWYKFALNYNANNSNGVFLLTIVPIWEIDGDNILITLRLLLNNLFPVFLNRPMLVLFFALVIYIIANFKKLDNFLGYCFIFSGLFFILFILIFFQVFTVHDYYLTNLFIFPVICFFCFLDIITAKGESQVSPYFKAMIVVLFIFNGFYAAASYRLKMIHTDKLCSWYPFITKEDKDLVDYYTWTYENTMLSFENIRPVLRQLGIKREDAFLSVTDESPDISLYFMDQKGYAFSHAQLTADTLSLQCMLPNVKYMVLTDQRLREEKPFKIVEPHFTSILKIAKLEIFKRND